MKPRTIGVGLAVVLAIGAGALTSLPAAACSCAPPGPPLAELAKAPAVFFGVPLSFTDLPTVRATDGRLVRPELPIRLWSILVLASWKGAAPDTLRIGSIAAGTACGVEFVVGRPYLVYTYAVPGTDTLFTGLCTRTRQFVQQTDEDLAALGTPAVDRRGERSWASFAPPAICPVHAGVKIRAAMSWSAFATSEAPMTDYEAVAARLFPYAALDLVRGADTPERRYGGSLRGADVCPMCRRAAQEWVAAPGAPCDVDRWIAKDAAEAEIDPRPVPAHELDDLAYRARYPNSNFAFLYDDGQRDQVDTIEGTFIRRGGVGYDHEAKFSLTREELDRIYEKMIAVRLFDVATPHPTYVPSAPLTKRGPCAGAKLFVRTNRFVRQYQWNLQHTAEPAKLVPEWGRLEQVSALIREILESRDEVKALPPTE